jgi:hypothetical protein
MVIQNLSWYTIEATRSTSRLLDDIGVGKIMSRFWHVGQILKRRQVPAQIFGWMDFTHAGKFQKNLVSLDVT